MSSKLEDFSGITVQIMLRGTFEDLFDGVVAHCDFVIRHKDLADLCSVG